MDISWTLVVLGALLQGMQCNAENSATNYNSISSTTVVASTTESTEHTTTLTILNSTTPSTSSASWQSTTSITQSALPTNPTSEPTKTSSSPDSITQASTSTTGATSPEQTESSSTVPNQGTPYHTSPQNSLATTQITTIPTSTPAALSTQNSPTTVIATSPNQSTTNLNKPTATTSKEDATTQLSSTQTNPTTVNKNPTVTTTAAPDTKSTASQSLGTTKAQTATALSIPGGLVTSSSSTPQITFNNSFGLNNSAVESITQESIIREVCNLLCERMTGNCSIKVKQLDDKLIAEVIIYADKKITPKNNQPAQNTTLQEKNVNNDTIPDTLIAILASCGALVLILCCFAAYCTYHRRSYRKNQQHLTEELQTVENGYHDNPTLEVMEVQPEMQEKKQTMNGEFNDSWIVPIDNLLKEDIPDEEDTHL